ncbi:MAG: trypsin-like peptidase domain-containing protein [Rhodospirillaceae bacterium]
MEEVKAQTKVAARSVKGAEKTVGLASRLMRSVVLIETDDCTLGAGFYIDETHVLTNNHVVENVKYAEMTTSKGLKSFGKVVKRSTIRDLALIRVNTKGTPAAFHNGAISAGDEVFSAGHPKGLTFSINKGIVSTTRKMSVSTPDSLQLTLIQTGAAINQGNSGGPLFLNGKVVGVNT